MSAMPQWPPYMDADATRFGDQLVGLYGADHGTHHASGVDVLGWVRWGSEYRFHRADGLSHDQAWTAISSAILTIWGVQVEPGPGPGPVPIPPTPLPGTVRPLQGYTRTFGRSFGDDSGPRRVHGCSDFAALVKHREDPDKSRRQLDVTAAHQQYVRVLWRLNGWHWSGDGSHASAGLTIDPIRDAWFEETLRSYLLECKARSLRVNLSAGDMNGWSESQQEHWFRRVAEISREVGEQTVWLQAITNEMAGTWAPGESDENIAQGAHLLQVVKSVYPWNHHAVSDPSSRDKAGMARMSPSPANTALIHDLRWMSNSDRDVSHAIRRAFNTMYENYPGFPVVQDEPTGPNGTFTGAFSQLVYQPFERPEDLFPLYTMHVLTGQASTYFNDPALCSRQPLESTWGFRELPALWAQMEIPEDIGQGSLKPGHHGDAPIRIGTGADRCDSVVAPGGHVAFGMVHGGSNWNVPSGWDAEVTFFGPSGPISSRRVQAGETLVTSSGRRDPVVVRLVR